MDILRTPEERFADLPGFDFVPHYHDCLPGFEALRMHYLDDGPGGKSVFLCLHGEPTWAYLYRRMIPLFVGSGSRAVAPDFFGFGRSDKPVEDGVYSFEFHRRSLLSFIEALDLRNIILVCQDWGGLVGLTLPMEMPERFAGLLVMNTMLATGDTALPPGLLAWRTWAAAHPDMEVGKLMGRACPHLSPAECAAYDAPFPDVRYKAGVRQFPQLVPDGPDAPGAALSRAARDWWKNRWQGGSFMAIGLRDPVLGGPVMHALRQSIRHCPAPMELAEAGHFTPEWGETIALRALAQWPGKTRHRFLPQ
jgi:haloalkane dehalogenase